MDLKSYLDQMGLRYRWSQHSEAFTSPALARREHVPQEAVVKPVLVKADGEFLLCALPASYRIDIDRLRMELGAEQIQLADEADLKTVFGDCETGAEPPVGWIYGLTTLMDDSLFEDPHVTFQAGTHRDAVTMSFLDYYRLARPSIGHFAEQARQEYRINDIGVSG
jgi:Ala-tRNA(Pro) deacylase